MEYKTENCKINFRVTRPIWNELEEEANSYGMSIHEFCKYSLAENMGILYSPKINNDADELKPFSGKIVFRCSKRFKDSLKRAAKRRGFNVSSFCRAALVSRLGAFDLNL